MSLSELIRGVEDHEKQLRVFNAGNGTVEAVRQRFDDRNVTVTAEETGADLPTEYVVLGHDEEFVTAVDLDAIVGQEVVDPGFDESDYQPILDHLDETMFTSYDIEQMVAASREIEDRAWRVGRGELHAGFQTMSVLADQLDVYTRLSEKDDLVVHAYAAPDRDVPDHGSDLTIHVERAEEIRESWFVAYDGAGVGANKCALLAEERDPGEFYGFWTYDPDTVDWLVEYLRTSYGLVEPA